MAVVFVRQNEPLEKALKRFKKKVDDEGILKEFKDRQYFVKPSVKRRLKKKEAIRKEANKQKKFSESLKKGR